MDAPRPPLATTTNDADELILDMAPYARFYKSGRVDRLLGTATVPAGQDLATAVTSKDVPIFPGVSTRIFLPDSVAQGQRLPILVYIHGGGFFMESAFSPTYTAFLNSLCSAARALAVSVDYRRAPEDPLPAAYDDSYAVLQWVFSRSDPWLDEHGDFEKLVIAGDSAGANIVHNMLVRHAEAPVQPPIFGAILIHPFFWGTADVGPRSREPQTVAKIEKSWKMVCPDTSGMDDPLLNPVAAAAAGYPGLQCRRVMVCVATEDLLSEWGSAYYKALAGSGFGGEVEMVETEGENHVFHLSNPDSAQAVAFLRRLAAFIRPAGAGSESQ